MNKSKFIKQPRFHQRRGFSVNSQLQKILLHFPDAQVVKYKGGYFEVVLKLRPTHISRSYEIKLVFEKYSGVKVYVINEILKLAKNRNKLPHVYSHSEQRLCLYSVSNEEWTTRKLIVSTIIPWISDWLFYYELWLTNGEWLGGGHDEYR